MDIKKKFIIIDDVRVDINKIMLYTANYEDTLIYLLIDEKPTTKKYRVKYDNIENMEKDILVLDSLFIIKDSLVNTSYKAKQRLNEQNITPLSETKEFLDYKDVGKKCIDDILDELRETYTVYGPTEEQQEIEQIIKSNAKKYNINIKPTPLRSTIKFEHGGVITEENDTLCKRLLGIFNLQYKSKK